MHLKIQQLAWVLPSGNSLQLHAKILLQLSLHLKKPQEVVVRLRKPKKKAKLTSQRAKMGERSKEPVLLALSTNEIEPINLKL